MLDSKFVSLHNHTEKSVLDALSSTKELFLRAKELGQSALAITDHASIAEAYDGLLMSRMTGVKLIVGCECYFLNDNSKPEDHLRHIILLAKNAIGYQNLLTLNRRGFDQTSLNGKRAYSIIDWKMLEQYHEGLICLTGCGNGVVNQLLMNSKFDEAESTILKLKEIFGDDLGLEIHPNYMKRGSNIYNDRIDQGFLNRRLIDYGKKYNIRVVPTCNSHYVNKEDYETHDVLLAIGSHQTVFSNFRLKYPVPDFYLKSYDEVKAFFSRNFGDELAEQLCENSLYFANLCEVPDWIEPKFSNPSGKELPFFPVKDEPDYLEFKSWVQNQNEYIRTLSEDKSFLRYKVETSFPARIARDKLTDKQVPEYRARIDNEYDVLETLDLCSYMLITADFLNFAKKNDISIGPGRGCMTADGLILTENGYKKIIDVNIGDNVYSHTGNLRKVLNKFEFKTDKGEKLLRIKTQHSNSTLTFTKNHKILASKSKDSEPEWLEVSSLREGDFVYQTYPKYSSNIENIPKQFEIGMSTIISSISETESDKVYDITVDQDHSYLTQNFAAHNSVGGSYIAYLLDIHCADSIKYDLVFERFHNKLKKAVSDIDNDIAAYGRERVIQYVTNKYGEDNVAHVSNINRNTPKVYIRDISRACELGGSKESATKLGNDIAGVIPAEIKSIDEAYNKVPLFAEYCKRYPEFLKYKKICNKIRSNGTHAAGVVVSKRPLTGLVPLRKDKEGNISLEYAKEIAEENGLVKIDFLGLNSLDIVEKIESLIEAAGKDVPNIDIEEYDKKAYDLITSGDTYGVFQFGTSGGTIDLCKKIKPKSIEDLSMITTIARPASKDIREDFIKTKNRKKEVALLHPKLHNALKKTFGFAIYDESLLILAKDIAGWDLGEADKLRKLTKEKGKNPKKAKQWRDEFIEGSIKNGLIEEEGIQIWEKVVEPFGKYSFNKSIFKNQDIDIYTSDGKFISTKQIQDVESGDYVRSRDESTGKDIFVQVLNKHDHGLLPLIELELVSGEKVRCTIEHKFRTNNGEMIPVWLIAAKSLPIVINSGSSKIKDISYIDEGQTYDLEIDHKDHQFYLSNGVLTSNSHAVLYSMLSFKMAYLKAHYPVEFLLANLMAEVNSNTPNAQSNIDKCKNELRANKVKILPPDINKSQLSYTIEGNNLLTGLDALKFVGEDAIKDILGKRPFINFYDFMSRVDSKKVRANNIQALIGSGALDSFQLPRKQMFLYCSDYRKKLQVWCKKHDILKETFIYPWIEDKEWTIQELYALEHFYIGESFICKPSEAHGKFFSEEHATYTNIKDSKNKTKFSSIKAIVRDFFEFRVKKETSSFYGKTMVKATFEDKNGEQFSCTIFPDRWEDLKETIKMIHSKSIFEPGLALDFAGTTNIYEQEVGVIFDQLNNISRVPAVPADLKAKKINLRETKISQLKLPNSSEQENSSKELSESLVEELEDQLYDQGLIDLDDVDSEED